jgi:ABC-type multidrug transport system permease subunit
MTEKCQLIPESPPSYPGVGVTVSHVPRPVTATSVMPQNYLGLTFFALLCCCCWPAFVFALIGFIFSVQVDNQYTNKDYFGAQRSSNLARKWSVAAIVTGLVVFFIFIAIRLTYFMLVVSKEDDDSGHDMD